VYTLEEENDKLRDEFEHVREDEGAERERLEALSAALKDVRVCTLLLPYSSFVEPPPLVAETHVCKGAASGDDGTV
jgi:hypothetical protein